MDQAPVLLAIDGTNLVRRVYEAARDQPPSQRAEHALRAALASFGRALSDHLHTHAVSVFDAGGETWRHRRYAAYKDNRKPTPQGLRDLVPLLTAALAERYRLQSLCMEDVEADDVLAVLVRRWRAAGRGPALILTADKDLCALVDDQVSVYHHFARELRDQAWVRSKFGVEPRQLQDFLALTGDVSDGIPGVPGVGPKKAAQYLAEFGSLDAILEHGKRCMDERISHVAKHRETALLARELVGFKDDLSLGATWGQFRRT